jgi:acyl carrier protein
VALEERFGFVIDEDDITADAFGTISSLATFIESRRGAAKG